MNRIKTRNTLKTYLKTAFKAEREHWSQARYQDEIGAAKNVTRRELISKLGQGVTAATLLGACHPLVAMDPKAVKISASDVKGFQGAASPNVVIIGAGFAGLTAALHLQKAGIPYSIYEARPRIGGRVMTQSNFNSDGMFIEWGAEFVDTVHTELIALAVELGLEVQDFVEPTPGLADEVYYINRKVLDPKSFIPEFRKLAAFVLKDTAPIQGPKGELILPGFGSKGPGTWIDDLSLQEYLSQKGKQGLSKDFIQLVELMYLGMMGLESDKQNAYNLLTLMDVNSQDMGLYGDSDESKRIRGGNSRLVEALARKIACHGPLNLNHQLAQIEDLGTHFSLQMLTGGTTKSIKADIVVMTVPVPVLKNVKGIQRLNLSPAKKNAILHLGYATNSKYSVGFTDRQWRQKGNIVPPNFGTVWSNLTFPEMRDSSNNQPGQSGIILNYLSGSQGQVIPTNLRQKTLAQLGEIYPGIAHKFDNNEHLQHWFSDPFALGSYVCPAPRHFQLMGGFEQQQELGGRLLFAGDSFSSDFGGYMNGAIETGKKAAQMIVAKASVLKKNPK